MSDNERRIFPMETVLEAMSGKKSNESLDFLGFVIQHQICEKSLRIVAPVVKGWLHSLHPDFMQIGCCSDKPFSLWVADAKKKLGDNVSIMPMPAAESVGIKECLDTIREMTMQTESKVAQAKELTAQLAEVLPFKDKFEALESKHTALEEKSTALNEEISSLKKELAAYSGKVALNENEIEQAVKDLVSKAVKEALASLPAAGISAGTGSAATSDESPVEVAQGSTVPDDFGFGTSGSDGDGFGF